MEPLEVEPFQNPCRFTLFTNSHVQVHANKSITDIFGSA
jgi:hypothetical protein